MSGTNLPRGLRGDLTAIQCFPTGLGRSFKKFLLLTMLKLYEHAVPSHPIAVRLSILVELDVALQYTGCEEL